MPELEWRMEHPGLIPDDKEHKHDWKPKTYFQGRPARFCKDEKCAAMQVGVRNTMAPARRVPREKK